MSHRLRCACQIVSAAGKAACLYPCNLYLCFDASYSCLPDSLCGMAQWSQVDALDWRLAMGFRGETSVEALMRVVVVVLRVS